MTLLIEMGIGWKPDPNVKGGLTSATDTDYVAEIEMLRAKIKRLCHHLSRTHDATGWHCPECGMTGATRPNGATLGDTVEAASRQPVR